MAEARAEPDREAKRLGIAGRRRSPEENGALEPSSPGRREILFIPDQGSVPVRNFRRCAGRAQAQHHLALRP
jgi:hypothetical protein